MDSPILNSAQMREAEEAAFARGIEVETLMDEAGAGVARAVQKFFPNPGTCIVFAGKGHNGGDALVAAAHLQRAGWKIDIRLPFAEKDCSELTRKKLDALQSGSSATLATLRSLPPSIILDGLLGLGATHLLREPVRSAAGDINKLRRERTAFVFAVDVPTGLNADSGEIDPEDCVVADCTVAIGFVKHGLVVDSVIDVVGRLEVVPLPELVADATAAKAFAATTESLRPLLPRRKFSAYKNQFGRIGVVAGSKGFAGAAVMTTQGALRAGAGLVEVFVPQDVYPIVAAAGPVEAMVKPVRNYRELLKEKIDIWALGPGLGQSRSTEIVHLIRHARQPMVIDADGLNILGPKIDILQHCEGPRLLTPHPGEMERLIETGKMSRAGIARNFCEKYPVTLLLKGSRTLVCESGKPVSYNTTGNPGMASGGMGDVLTGVCAGLLGHKMTRYNAARLAAWVCGRAAEMSIFQFGASEESLLASDVLAHLGDAFNELRGASA